MRFGIVLISLREMVWCGLLSCLRSPTEQLRVIKLFDILSGLKKSVIRTCLVDVLSNCGKDSVRALDLWVTGLGFGLGFLEVEAHTKEFCRFCGLWYAFMTCFWCRNSIVTFAQKVPIGHYYIRHPSSHQDGRLLPVLFSPPWVLHYQELWVGMEIVSVHSSSLNVWFFH